jgi:hypothetical protein
MRRALTKLLPEDHQSLETRSCKQRNNSERPSYQNVPVSLSSPAFFFDSVFAVVRAAHYLSAWKLVSFCHFLLRKRRNKVPENSLELSKSAPQTVLNNQ